MSYAISSTLKPGDQVTDYLRLVASVGSDPTGTVWEAIHAYEGRVSVKVFRETLGEVEVDTIDDGETADGRTFVVCALEDAAALVNAPESIPATSYDELHDKLTCHPPLKRSWLPMLAAAAAAVAGALYFSGILTS